MTAAARFLPLPQEKFSYVKELFAFSASVCYTSFRIYTAEPSAFPPLSGTMCPGTRRSRA